MVKERVVKQTIERGRTVHFAEPIEPAAELVKGSDGKLSLSELKGLHISAWSELTRYIPEELLRESGKLLHSYFRVQLRIVAGKKIKARRLLAGLDKDYRFRQLEERHENILAAIDLAVRGKSTRDGVKPSFVVQEEKEASDGEETPNGNETPISST